jgi:nucleotide-binding universal stress UspA family protein
MKTFIVPTDFSDTSKNAARFAANVAQQLPDAHIILYNVYERIETENDGSVVSDDHHGREKIMELALESVKADMLAQSPRVNITCYAEEEDGSFINSLERLAKHKEADMIIMGITGVTPIEQIFIGSNTLSMVSRNICPVMIVPPHASFTGIKNIAFTSDFKDVETTTPVKSLQAVLNIFKPFVHVVNVDAEHYVELTDDYKAEKAKLDKMLSNYEREYYFIRQYDFIEAINQFVVDRNIDLLLTVPKKHSFLGGLFRSSYTKKLAYHSHVPLIAVHE